MEYLRVESGEWRVELMNGILYMLPQENLHQEDFS